MARIEVYTTPDCPYCKMTKEWLREHGCEFEELDITSDVEALREWRSPSGGAGVPVVAHGKDLVIGFDPDRIAQLVNCTARTSEVDVSRLEAEAAGT